MENAVHLLSRQSSDFAISHLLAKQLVDDHTVVTNSLATRLDTAEAKASYTDPTTQTLLDVEKGRINDIVALSSAELNTLKEIADHFTSEDNTLSTAITALVTEHNTELATETADSVTSPLNETPPQDHRSNR